LPRVVSVVRGCRLKEHILFTPETQSYKGKERTRCKTCGSFFYTENLVDGFCWDCNAGLYSSKTEKLIKKHLSASPAVAFAPAEKHPSNNMGAEITTAPVAPEENQVLIDWLSWTLKDLDPDVAIEKSGLSGLAFIPSKGGGMGYKQSRRCGNIVVFFDGQDSMGCHISMTGQGCRQYEGWKQDKKHCWYQLLHNLTAIGATVTRLDIALDNVDGALDLYRLENAIQEKQIRSIFKGGSKHEKFTFGDETEKQGKTIYIGSPASRIKFRFYDKAAQLGIQSHWVRCELQLMAERAQEAVKHLIAPKPLEAGTLAVSVLNQYFAVINLDDSNKSRCSLQDWWSAWLATTDKLRLTVYKSIKIIPQVMDFLRRQYAPTFGMLHKFLDSHSFSAFVRELTTEGKKRLTSKHEFIIECSQLEPLPF